MDDEDADSEESGSTRKRRGQLERQDTSELGELGVKGVKGSEVDPDVKQVTRGVKEVELQDKKEESGSDGGEGASEEAPKTTEGESSAEAPLDPASTQNDDGLSQVVTVTEDEVPAGQSKAIAEAPSNDPPEVEEPKSTDIGEPLITQGEEKEPLDVTPGAKSDEVADTRVSDESSPEP